MGYTKEKVAYLRGVVDGMDLGEDKYAKLFKLIVETMDEMADTIDENEESIIDLDECLDDMSDEITDINDCLDALIGEDDDDDIDFDEDDDECCCCCCDDDDDYIEFECPGCGEKTCINKRMLENDNELVCPNCKTNLVPKFDGEDE